MHILLNVPILDTNRSYQIFSHHSFVLPYPLTTMCSYSEQVEETVQVLVAKRTNSNLSNVIYELLMRYKFWR